jgi:hypothetical protein
LGGTRHNRRRAPRPRTAQTRLGSLFQARQYLVEYLVDRTKPEWLLGLVGYLGDGRHKNRYRAKQAPQMRAIEMIIQAAISTGAGIPGR